MSTINKETLALYENKCSQIADRAELEKLAALALYHLQVVSGSRNSFINCAKLERSCEVAKMQYEAAYFIDKYKV